MNYTFESFEELFEFMNDKQLKISDLKVEIKDTSEENEIESTSSIEEKEVLEDKNLSLTAKILSMKDSPYVKVEESNDDQNILYVKDFSYIKDACSMSKINLMEKDLYVGICNENNTNKINLLVEILQDEDNKIEKPITFIVEKSLENQEEKMIINKKELNFS